MTDRHEGIKDGELEGAELVEGPHSTDADDWTTAAIAILGIIDAREAYFRTNGIDSIETAVMFAISTSGANINQMPTKQTAHLA